MNYYRRYIGDYAADTAHLNLAEHGAYALLLDSYYSTEKALPSSLELLYRICRAHTPLEKKAVKSVADAYFPVDSTGELRRNARADKELGIAVPKIEKMREVARENGKKGGRKPKEGTNSGTKTGTETGTHIGSEKEPSLKQPARLQQPPTASHQPPSNPPSEQRSQGRDTERSAPRERSTQEQDPTPAEILAEILVANGHQVSAAHPLVIDWTRDGVTPEQLRTALTTARMRKGEASYPLSFLDRILDDRSKPQAPTRWRSDDGEARKLCDELGISRDGRGETREAWHQRIEYAIAQQARAKVA